MDSNQLIAYDEPNKDGSNNHVVLTVGEAIDLQNQHALDGGYHYQDIAEALGDFMALNWAYFVEPDGITPIL